MREIKFRAWNGEFMEVRHFNIVYNPMKELWDLPTGRVLMQFTGIKDRNGKEIYEGDIIEKGKLVYTIVMCKGEWSLMRGTVILNLHISNLDFLDERCLHLEVIGNIYENPELLGDRK